MRIHSSRQEFQSMESKELEGMGKQSGRYGSFSGETYNLVGRGNIIQHSQRTLCLLLSVSDMVFSQVFQ